MKTNTTQQREEGRAQVQSEQVFRAPEGEFNKYIVLRFNRREQVAVFPFAMKQADVFGYMRRECPELEAISAGFFILDAGAVWTTGNSESLHLSSRPGDAQAIAAFLRSLDRQVWDLVRLAGEAQEAARREMTEAVPC